MLTSKVCNMDKLCKLSTFVRMSEVTELKIFAELLRSERGKLIHLLFVSFSRVVE